jgi:hypothetical protein
VRDAAAIGIEVRQSAACFAVWTLVAAERERRNFGATFTGGAGRIRGRWLALLRHTPLLRTAMHRFVRRVLLPRYFSSAKVRATPNKSVPRRPPSRGL